MKTPSRFRHLVPACAVTLAMLASIVPTKTQAANLCTGEFLTSLVHPWPAGVAFNVPFRETSLATTARAQAFRAGLQGAGIAVDPDGRAVMHVVFSLRPSRSAPAAAQAAEVNSDMNWRPGVTPSMTEPSLVGSSLNLTVIVSDSKAYQQIWIGSMECTIQTSDTEALARDLGGRLGQAVSASLRQR